jgi:hypothetical protein
MKSLYEQAFGQTKLAQEVTDRVLDLGSSITAAAMRDRILQKTAAPKTAAGTPQGDVYDQIQDSDQEAATVQELQQELLAPGKKPKALYQLGSKITTAAEAFGTAMNHAAGINLIEHAKIAESPEATADLFEKVACILCNQRGCGFCEGLGIMTKAAALEAIDRINSASTIEGGAIVADMAKQGALLMTEKDAADMAPMVAEGLDELDSATLEAKLHPAEPPPQSFGQLHYNYHPLAKFLGTNF